MKPKKPKKVSIVMANYNRRLLLINTLKTIQYYNLNRNIEVIIVDDASCQKEQINDIPDKFDIPIIIIPLTIKEKHWTCDCVPFNIGFTYITGDIVIIQNPENLHVGDIVGYALKNIDNETFLSFALYSVDQRDTNNLYKKAISKGIYDEQGIRKVMGKLVARKDKWTDGDTCWYNHSRFQPAGHHLISAITRINLERLKGFDERYSFGFAFTDFELRERLKRLLKTKIIDCPFAVHQRHDLAAYGKFNKEFESNKRLFLNVTLKEKQWRSPANVIYNPVPNLE